jgi:hypothetical protein
MPYAKVPHDQFCFILFGPNTFMVAFVADRMNSNSSGKNNVIISVVVADDVRTTI